MSNPNPNDDEDSPMSFADFPEDVQLCVLSFLSPSDITAFASTSKRCVSLCRRSDSRLWHAMCDRRWGSHTDISQWRRRAAAIPFRQLYRTLSGCEALIGFWRRSGGDSSSPPLILFDWGPHYVSGSRVSPSRDGTYSVVKSPFLRVSLSAEGETVGFLAEGRGQVEAEAVAVNVSFMGRTHIVVEEEEEDPIAAGIRRSSSSKNLRDEGEDNDEVGSEFGSPGSLPDRLVSEVYQYFANRTSPVGDRAARRQRRRDKERRGRRRKWDPQHFVKIVNCSPTPARPLQGLWKGIYDDDMNLGFYLITYDDIGCITCRKVWNSPENISNYGQLFWVSDTSFIESPFPMEEQSLYAARVHLRPIPDAHCIILDDLSLAESSALSRILHINSSFDLVVPYSERSCARAKGRIWQYEDGTFGFGFLEDNFVIDLKRVSENGLLDAVGLSGD